MRFRLPDNQIVQMDAPFEMDGVQYPANWLRLMTPEQRVAFGAVELPEPPQVDQRFYYVTENEPGSYQVTPKPLAQALAVRVAELATLRFGKETSGVGGFSTDRESQALITGAALAATLDPAYTVDWKGANGWVKLNATQLLAAAQAVRAHVQACFSNERVLYERLAAAATLDELIAVDLSVGWPA